MIDRLRARALAADRPPLGSGVVAAALAVAVATAALHLLKWIAPGRTYRDALRRLLGEEQSDRIIVSATESPRVGLSGEELEWLLERVPAEILILRPAPDDTRLLSAAGVRGHF